MVDIALQLDAEGGDLALESGDLKRDDGLRTAVLLSLFTDRRASDDQGGAADRRGWWADDSDDRFGSHLWLLGRAKITDETLNQAREYVFGALEWLLADGIAETVNVEAERNGAESIALGIEIVRGSAELWPDLWSSEVEVFDVPGGTVKLLTS